jgi:hypothetical protein
MKVVPSSEGKEKDMNEEQLLHRFLEAMKRKLPPGEPLVPFLTRVLCLGKEAVYRRLRGEVPFSFAEMARVTTQTRLSLDELIGGRPAKEIPFYFTRPDERGEIPVAGPDTDLNMQELTDRAVALRYPDSSATIAINSFPVAFLVKYPHLLRLRLLKRLYLRDHDKKATTYGQVLVPAHLLRYCRESYFRIAKIDRFHVILDKMIFAYLLNDIRAFALAGLLSRDEVDLIKRDTLTLVDGLERAATIGRNDMRNNLEFHLSETNLESTYFHAHTGSGVYCAVGIFSTNAIFSFDRTMYEAVKAWVDSLTNVSCLITRAGEVQRRQYFRQQRELVATL